MGLCPSNNEPTGSNEYAYDPNGNMISDENKVLTVSCYNHLNLPQNITIESNAINKINYLYDAVGIKLCKQTRIDGPIEKTTDYIGNFVYEDDGIFELRYMLTDEGRVMANPDGTFNYQYFLKDHLGNTRVTFNQNGEVVQEDSYYPFGMAMNGLNFETGLDYKNKYLYNGKELQDEFGLGWYDYGRRYYDPSIARFTTIDPLSENYYSFSPFSYCAGNPVSCRDEDGEWINFVIGAIVGAATDYALQVATNYLEGKTGTEAWTDVDGASIALSAGAGAIGVGVAAKAGKAMKVAKLAKGVKTAITVGSEVATDAAASSMHQIITIGEVDLKDVAIDATAGQIVGKTVNTAVKNKVQASKAAKVLHNQADRAQRVAKGSREVRQVAADKATQKAENYGAGRAIAAGSASSGTASTVVKELDEKDKQ